MQEKIGDKFERDGFCVTPQVYEADAIARVNAAVDAVLQGKYETGIAPFTAHDPAHLTQPLVKIDNPHQANRSILSFLTDRRFGEWAARVTGAKRVRIWATQLLIKRPRGEQLAGGVGWHRDETYWQFWTPNSRLFTAWIALSDVRLESGPVCMVAGSHRWPDSAGGNFFDDDLDVTKAAFAPPSKDAWREVPMILPPGTMSFHDKRTIHGSYGNASTDQRRSFAIHMCTEEASIRPDAAPNQYVDYLDDSQHTPVIWEANKTDAGDA